MPLSTVRILLTVADPYYDDDDDLLEVERSQQFEWNVLTEVSSSCSFEWNVSQIISRTQQFAWNTLELLYEVSSQHQFAWNILTPISCSKIFQWNIWERVTSPHMNLFLDAHPTEIDSSLDLSIYGSDTPLILLGIDLYISGETATHYNSLNLVIYNQDMGELNQSMNLYIKGEEKSSSSSLDLYIQNNGIYNSIPLFIKGLGTQSGFHPENSSMNLYIQRNEAAAIDLFLAANEGVNNSMDLYVLGGVSSTGSLDLSIPHVFDVKTANIPLYIHGFK